MSGRRLAFRADIAKGTYSRVYEQGHDLLALQQLLGHSSPATTQIYVGISRDRLRRWECGMSDHDLSNPSVVHRSAADAGAATREEATHRTGGTLQAGESAR